MLLDLPKQIHTIWTNLGSPLLRIGEQLSDIQGHLNCRVVLPRHQRFLTPYIAEKRAKIMRWTSLIRTQDHYEDAKEDILEGTGEWLFRKQEYQEWIVSSVSSILWLRGNRK
jgi:hypothetical protein